MIKNRIEISREKYVEMQEILWDFAHWLHEQGYIDTDYYCEEPKAVDDYMTKYKMKKII